MSIIFRFVNNLQITSVFKQNLHQVRAASYYGSQFVEDLENTDKVKYKVTNDHIDWQYVQRALPPLLIPSPTEKVKYPSGWKPQAKCLKDSPYFIERTKSHMIPVYLILKQRGIKRYTIIRKISGDIFKLERELREFLQKESFQPIKSQVNEFVGYIRISGDFVNACKYWLEQRNF